MGSRRRGGIPEALKAARGAARAGVSRPNSEQDEGLGPVLGGVYLGGSCKAPPTLASGIPASAATSMKKRSKNPHLRTGRKGGLRTTAPSKY